MRPGDLVKHVSDAHCNKFGVGIVTNIISMGNDGSRGIVKVCWQFPPTNLIYPADLFTPEGLIIISEANSQDDIIITNENQTR
tara:strand:+ start:153 stop:401 length:249 start_codon:yes stop_codon:yes gene_type:complete